MPVVHVNTKKQAIGFEIQADDYDMESFTRYMMQNGYWIKIDPIPESTESIIWIKADEIDK